MLLFHARVGPVLLSAFYRRWGREGRGLAKVTELDLNSGPKHAPAHSPSSGGKCEQWQGGSEGPGGFGEQLEGRGGRGEVAGNEAAIAAADGLVGYW